VKVMNKFKKIIVLSLVLTLPLNIFSFIWLFKTLDTYFLLDRYELTMNKNGRLYNIGVAEFESMVNHTKLILGMSKETDVKLIINKKGENKLYSDLPKSGVDYVKGSYLIINNKVIKGKAKLRGDHMYHWAKNKKSWRFKTSKKDIHEGINKINLIILKTPDKLSNLISYKLAQSLNLLAPDAQLVEFSINGKYNGSRLMAEQIDESFLRKNRRMPNDIYKGDNIGQKKFIGVNVDIFNNASIWEKASYNNHYDKNSHTPVQSMLKNMQSKTYQIYDLESFAAFSVLIDLAASYHYDGTHNWIIYYDNYFEKMFPIIWDTTGWNTRSVHEKDVNIATSILMKNLFLNYHFIRFKYQVLNKFYRQNKDTFITALDAQIEIAKEIIHNQNGISLGNSEFMLENSLKTVDKFKSNVQNKLFQIKTYFIGNIDKKDYSYAKLDDGIRMSIAGSKLIKQITLTFSQRPTFNKSIISYKVSQNEHNIDISTLSKLDNDKLIIDIELLANAFTTNAYSGTKTLFKEASYDLHLNGIDINTLKAVTFTFDNYNQQSLTIKEIESINPLSFNSNYVNIVQLPDSLDAEIWSGEKTFTGFNLIKNDIVIEKGTIIKLAEKATLKVLGKVTAIGTKEQPIIFKAIDNTKPWGAFALKDEKANGSILKNVIFKGGSGDKGDLYEYTAMLSIHNVKDITIEDSEFYDSKLTDDMVHVIYSQATFRNTKFIRSLSDALDVDISDIIIDNCEFINSGNDSIDLMTTNAIVTNTRFNNSADKGISIGEGSNLLAINNLIVGSEIGMQSKDTSRAYIYNSSFINNKKAIDAYHKNWRYEQGGTIFIDKSIFKGNQSNATVGKKSKVVINNSQIDTPENLNAKHLRKKKIIISNEDKIDYNFEETLFKNQENLIQQQQGYHE